MSEEAPPEKQYFFYMGILTAIESQIDLLIKEKALIQGKLKDVCGEVALQLATQKIAGTKTPPKAKPKSSLRKMKPKNNFVM